MFRRMGELLVEYGEITLAQLDQILAEQRQRYRPFGTIAADLCHVHETAIWRAWAHQYAQCCPRVRLSNEVVDESVLHYIHPQQAWEYRMLPLREHDGDLIVVTSQRRLPLSLHYIDRFMNHSVVVWLADSPSELEKHLKQHYPDCNKMNYLHEAEHTATAAGASTTGNPEAELF
ncbi:MAG: hypothetical protein HND57_15460 [Planctomycetes bacterium]|nr:hypothetical protein [Planctomycetota bacterium]